MLRITFTSNETKRKTPTRKPEQAELADEVAAMFSSTPVSWPLDWQALAGATPPMTGGLYALGFPQGIQYDRGVSRLVYIGSAENLSRRFAFHVRNAQNHAIWELQTLSPLSVTWWTLPAMGRRWLYTLEGEAICVFERTFGTIPFGNWAVPESPHAGDCRDWIVIPPCDASGPLCVDGLMNTFRRRFCPIPGIKSITANQWYYGDFIRPSNEELEEKYRKRELQRTMEQLSTILKSHADAWTIKKLVGLLQVCRTLQALPKQSTVTRFAALTRAIPRPHTWGEVALVQGRLVAGSWNPEQRLWLKVLYGKELLGDAKLESYWFSACDRSELPQISKPRTEKHVEACDRLEYRFQAALATVCR